MHYSENEHTGSPILTTSEKKGAGEPSHIQNPQVLHAADKFRSQAQQANEKWLCLRIQVPIKHIDTFISLPHPEKTVWIPGRGATQHASDWQIAALGCAREIIAQGANRFQTVQQAAAAVFSEISVMGDAPASHFPQLRFLGGAAFAPGSANTDIWSEFSDARFVIPRWQYATQSNDATLQLVIESDEFHRSPRWHQELNDIFNWLMQADALQMPATETVNITHYSNGWETLVNDALKKIAAGELQKVVVSRMSHLKSNLAFSLQRVLQRLARSYPDCMRFALSGSGSVFVGATPEELVRVSDKGKRIAADALAGSAQRTGDSDNGALRLQRSEKEHREFEFVLDNIEAQLRRCGVRITSDRDIKIKSLKNLYHLHCAVTGIAESPMHILQLVEQLHPTPAVCGTPTAIASNWLVANEHQQRGWYAGPIGWFDADGDGCFAVGIRSALVKNDEAWLFAGAGIVEGSCAAVEFTETGAKLTPMLSALGAL